MLTCRQLTEQDYDSLKNLIGERPEVFNGYSDELFIKQVNDKVDAGILTDPYFFNIGIFQEDELIAVSLFKEMYTQPAWVWGYWVAKKGFNGWFSSVNRLKEGIELLQAVDTIVFDEMEVKRGLNRFYVAYPFTAPDSKDLRGLFMSDRLFTFLNRAQGKNLRITKYKAYTDCMIEPNTEPKYPYQQQIIGERTYPIKLGIRMVCKETQSGIANGSDTSPVSPSIT